MATSKRATILTTAHKVLKKHYEPVDSDPARPVLEQLLYACCLENARYDKADEAFTALKNGFYDWNEIRVTTVGELSESLVCLPDPNAAAVRIKRSLQSVFESEYEFSLEDLRKQNLGKAIKQLEKYEGMTPFVVAYITQSALGGHSIPVDEGALRVLTVLDVITAAEAKKKQVPGMERAISKSKGIEFGSLLHQLAAAYFASPHSTQTRSVILAIDPSAKSRFPKRGSKGEAAATEKAPAAKAPAAKTPAAKTPIEKKPADKKAAAKTTPPPPKKAAKKAPASKKAEPKKADKKAAVKKTPSKRLAKKKPR
jgi:endonuclease III